MARAAPAPPSPAPGQLERRDPVVVHESSPRRTKLSTGPSTAVGTCSHSRHTTGHRAEGARCEHELTGRYARQTRQSGRSPRGPHLWTSLWVSMEARCASSVRMRAPHTGGQPVDNRWTTHRRTGERAGVSCGRDVREKSASTAGPSLCAAASTRRAQADTVGDLRRRAPSTECTPPTTMTRSLHSAIQPRVPTLLREAGTTAKERHFPRARSGLADRSASTRVSAQSHLCCSSGSAARERAGSDGEVQGRT